MRRVFSSHCISVKKSYGAARRVGSPTEKTKTKETTQIVNQIAAKMYVNIGNKKMRRLELIYCAVVMYTASPILIAFQQQHTQIAKRPAMPKIV